MTSLPLPSARVRAAHLFALCAFGLAFAALKMRDRLGSRTALAMGMLALAFSVNIFFISVSKTGLLMVAALLALFIVHSGGWRRMLLLTFPSLLVIAIAIWLSAPAQRRLEGFVADMRAARSRYRSVSGRRKNLRRKHLDRVAPGFLEQGLEVRPAVPGLWAWYRQHSTAVSVTGSDDAVSLRRSYRGSA